MFLVSRALGTRQRCTFLIERWWYVDATVRVGWGGVGWGGAITFMCLAFKLMLRWSYVHDRLWLFDVLLALAHARHATLGWGGVGCGGVGWRITFKYTSTYTSCYATARSSCTCTHTSCYATARSSDFVGKPSAMAALCDPLGLDPNPMPFLLWFNNGKKIAHGRTCRNLSCFTSGCSVWCREVMVPRICLIKTTCITL